jgi:hypothetical protein
VARRRPARRARDSPGRRLAGIPVGARDGKGFEHLKTFDRRLLGLLLWGCASLLPAQEDTPTQLWGNVTLTYPKEKWSFELDFEPKTLVSGGEDWWNVDVTSSAEHYPHKRLDLTGEFVVGFTKQTENVDSLEVTARLGLRINLLNNLREQLPIHHHPLGRVRISTLIRVEHRHFRYAGGGTSEDEWRLRARIESKIGVNHEDLSKDKTLYVLADIEAFESLDEELDERYVTKGRFRAGLGFRFSYETRAEILYIHDWVRDSPGGEPQPDAEILDLKLKLYF